MADDGALIAIWIAADQPGGDIWDVYGQTFDAAGAPQGGEFRVNTWTTHWQEDPVVACDPDGNFVVAWESTFQDGSDYGIYAQRYAVPTPPAVSDSSFRYATAPHKLQFTFSQDVSASLGVEDIILENLTTTQTIPSGDLSLSYDALGNVATYTYSAPTGALPDGRYRATLVASGITNPSGLPLPANVVFEFVFLRGDANNDGRVNLLDFDVLAGNFGQSPRDFTQGDFNYDTLVNLADFDLLAGRFGIVVGPQARTSFGDDKFDRPEVLEDLA
jgi:hypothetical protein